MEVPDRMIIGATGHSELIIFPLRTFMKVPESQIRPLWGGSEIIHFTLCEVFGDLWGSSGIFGDVRGRFGEYSGIFGNIREFWVHLGAPEGT
jgi:hypothetical protein